MTRRTLCAAAALILRGAAAPGENGWRPAPLATRWAREVTPDRVLPEYPRPQMVRERWLNLNGTWEFETEKNGGAVPFGRRLARRILVPFPMESSLSGVRETAEFAWYRCTFSVPPEWRGQHILLHFGAVDWETTVYVNGRAAGTHRGATIPLLWISPRHLRPRPSRS